MRNHKYLRHHKRQRAPRAPYSVALIDMQDNYPAAHNRDTGEGVMDVLRAAIADGAGIILVHWRRMGRVRADIRRLLRGYPHVRKVYETQVDGSAEISVKCEKHGFSRKHIVVCGIQSMVCVAGSALGLCERLPHATIEVVKNACGDLREPNWETFPFSAPIDPRRPNIFPPRPRNMIVTERLVGPMSGLKAVQSKATAAHPDVMASWSKRALSASLPSRRPDVLFASACRPEAHENDLEPPEISSHLRPVQKRSET